MAFKTNKCVSAQSVDFQEGFFYALEIIYKELDTMKWIGADEGWDLATTAVRNETYETMKNLYGKPEAYFEENDD